MTMRSRFLLDPGDEEVRGFGVELFERRVMIDDYETLFSN